MKKAILLLSCAAFIAFASPLYASQGRKPEKTGILLVAFGSSEASAQAAFDNIEKRVREVFPETPLYWAYTSHIIRHKLVKQGKVLLSPAEALARMMDEGFTRVAVQSLHTIPGEEFGDLQETVRAFQGMPDGFMQLALGEPLLATQQDLGRAVDAILATIPPARKPSEAVLLMGHGTPHPANAYYSALNWQMQQKDPNLIIGTVEGYPEIGQVADYLKKRKAARVWLMPFMSVAGDHAKNDMAGPEEDSWVSVLTKQGFDCRTVLKGTAEYDVFVDIWVDHLRSALGRLDQM
ncbi:MAG: sirohydrochlorin cobaltochelatase [Thermodesulfobacteriota bacterium]